MRSTMCATVFGASSGYVSNSNVPLEVSTTITGATAVCPAAPITSADSATADASALTRMRDANPPAVLANGAGTAARRQRPAHVLAPRDEIEVDVRPPARSARAIQRLLRLLGSPRPDP